MTKVPSLLDRMIFEYRELQQEYDLAKFDQDFIEMASAIDRMEALSARIEKISPRIAKSLS